MVAKFFSVSVNSTKVLKLKETYVGNVELMLFILFFYLSNYFLFVTTGSST